MTAKQRAIKYLAIAFAVFLIVSIVGGILKAIFLIAGLSGYSNVSEELSSFEITEEVKSLDIEIGAADVKFTHEGEDFVVDCNLKNVKVNVRNGELRVIEKTRLFKNYEGAAIYINIPYGYSFDEVDVEMGAGRLEISDFSANELSLTLGAGETVITNVSSQRETNIEGGAGKITVSDCSFGGLELDMGVGEMRFSGTLPSSSDLNLGIGSVYINLLPDETEYTIEANKGIGDIHINGTPAANGGRYGNGKNLVCINGGIGSVDVSFGEN